jgi:Dyp-type peroxidase family
MGQAKGVLPRRDDADVLKDPRAGGYFIATLLADTLDRPGAEAWLRELTGLVDELVAPPKGSNSRAGAVAVGLSPTFFGRGGGSRFDPPLQIPAGFASDAGPLPVPPGSSAISADVMLYVVSTFEARVNAFLSKLAASPTVTSTQLYRGYQREDDTEPFGYRDGLRNVERTKRSGVVYVDPRRHFEEPEGAADGSYMAYMRIAQHPAALGRLAPEQQDQVIGRQRDGTRLDLAGQGIDPRREPSEPTPQLPATSHVGKVGPRGGHDDTAIFRRGLPFVETTSDGKVQIGLNFCSFQASLSQFDVVFGDWAMNTQFPPQPGGGAPGVDALLDPGRGLTTILAHGYYFVPPADPKRRFIGATLFDAPPTHRPAKTGHFAVIKRVSAQADPNARFERRGFTFQVLDAAGQPVGDPFTTDSTGRAISPELEVGQAYTVREVATPQIPNLQAAPDQAFTLERPNQVVQIQNTVTQPGGYGSV